MATTTNGIYYPNDYNAAADIPSDLKTMAESIDKNIQDNKYNDTKIKQNITDLQTKNTDQDEKIETIETEQLTQNDLLQRTQSALINITTEKSSNINVKDSSNLNAKIGVFGTSSQETRSGKNKFDINKLNDISQITEKDSTTGTFTLSNAWVTQILSNKNIIKDIKPSTQYKCVADVTLLAKPDNIKSGTNHNILLCLYNGTNQISICNTNDANEKNNWTLNETKKMTRTFTTPEDLTSYRMIGYTYYTDEDKPEGSFKFENIMILEATEEDETFEEAGETPSPEIPSEIKNVTGDINVITTNENLAVADWAERFVNVVNNNSKARLEETDGRKCLFYNADAGYQNDDAYFFKYIFKKNTRYVISFYIKPSTMQGNFAIKYTDGSMGSVQNLIAGEWQKVVIYTKTNATVEEVCVQYLSGNCRIDLDTIQITEGTTEKEYIKNQGQTITFPLQEGQRLADGDKLADDGIHHKRKQITITEDMLIQGIVTTYTNLDYIRIKKPTDFAGYNNPKANISLISFAKEFTDWTFDSANYINKYTCRLQYAHFMLGIEKGTTYAEIKDKLIGQTIEYELAEEEIEPYTPAQQEAYNKLQNVLSYKTVTNVFTDTALLEFKYVADTETWVINEIKPLKEQISTINELLSTTGTSALLLDNMQTDLESEVI